MGYKTGNKQGGMKKVVIEQHGNHTDYICEACNMQFHTKEEAMEHGKKHRNESGSFAHGPWMHGK